MSGVTWHYKRSLEYMQNMLPHTYPLSSRPSFRTRCALNISGITAKSGVSSATVRPVRLFVRSIQCFGRGFSVRGREARVQVSNVRRSVHCYSWHRHMQTLNAFEFAIQRNIASRSSNATTLTSYRCNELRTCLRGVAHMHVP